MIEILGYQHMKKQANSKIGKDSIYKKIATKLKKIEKKETRLWKKNMKKKKNKLKKIEKKE